LQECQTPKYEISFTKKTYHIYNRGINSCFDFENDENKGFKSVSKYLGGKVKLLAYCLMDNHFHFVIQISDVKGDNKFNFILR
jgi:REP element-mobilizing transposase RayT